MTQVFFTARELAEVATKRGVTAFPQSERGVQVHAAREGWIDLPPNLCRKRKGLGGGREYHQSLLPFELQQALASRDMKVHRAAEVLQRQESDGRKLATLKTASLSARQRGVMEARSQVLLAIEAYQIPRGQSRASAVKDFGLAQAEFRHWLTDPEMFGLTEAVLTMANDRQKGDQSISIRTIQRWFAAREARGVAGLAPVVSKEADPVPPGFVDFLKHYAIGSKPHATEALAAYMDTNPAFPLTIDQVRHTLKVKLNDIEKNVGREGLLTLRSRMAYIQRTTEGLWPTTIYTADGKTFDAEIADPVSGNAIRPEITSVLDVATRKCVGIAISRKENVIAVVEALRRSCTSNGVCAIFYTDRGPGYKNKTVDGDVGGLMGRLSITKMHALPYNSQAKGIIERFNGTCWNPLARRLPTYIGETMDKQAGNAIHKLTRSEIKQFGRSNNLPTWEHFLAMCEQTVTEYNDAPHSGLPKIEDPITGKMRHMSPNECWASHVASGFEPVTIDADEEDDLFRPYEVRICRRALVEWNKNQYFHTDLEAWHSRKVWVGYDLHRADKVWVREFEEEDGQPGRLICVAEFSGNKERYIPHTYQREAEEKRVKGQLKRIGKKQQQIVEQLDDARLIDLGVAMPMPVITPEPELAEVVRPMNFPKPKAVPRAQHPDVELAFDVLADASKLTSGRRQLLLDLTAGRAGREFLRISGVDLAMLDDLLRSAA
ncbi:hypothetical protein GCM10010873_16270 [Cypionkella aquatica]|uniref:Transposase n=1 Tax=Cypionkella aquatica TaxID=1756042 RepID=A0AA37TSJ9_9RHOB|nr:Mu transposase C-terminal domain-containing protein [Cypionkella aquatica]GLS86653.1 hypothetical protein GCM10010873_16270 [Cypionkella aquatica]